MKIASHQLKPDDALDHFLAMIGADGKKMSDDYASMLSRGYFFVLAPENTPLTRLQQLKLGGIVPSRERAQDGNFTIERVNNCAHALAEVIHRNFQNRKPLIAIREPYLTLEDKTDLVKDLTDVDGSLFKVIRENIELPALSRDIARFATPWSFLLFVVETREKDMSIAALVRNAELIAVNAYDGESYLYWVKHRNYLN